jgi:hypothetical protein
LRVAHRLAGHHLETPENRGVVDDRIPADNAVLKHAATAEAKRTPASAR